MGPTFVPRSHEVADTSPSVARRTPRDTCLMGMEAGAA